MAVGFPKTSNMYNDEFLRTLQEVSPPDMTGDFSFDFGDRLPPGFRPGPGFTPPPGFRPIPGFRPTPGYMPPGYTDPTQGPTLGPDEFGSYTIPFSDPTYSSGFNYARSIAGGIPMSQVIAPGVSYSPDQPMGYTQEQLNTPIGTTPVEPPPTPPTTPPPPDDPGFFGGIGGVTIPTPPPPPGFFNIFGGTPPSGAFGDFLTNLLGGLGEGTGGTRGPSDAQVGDGMPKPPVNVGGPVVRPGGQPPLLVGGPVPIRGPQPVLVGGPATRDATPINYETQGPDNLMRQRGDPIPLDDDFISGPRPLPGFDAEPILVGGPPSLPGGGTTVLPEPQPVSGLPVPPVQTIQPGLGGITSNPMGITPIAPPMGGMGLPSLPQAPIVPDLGLQGPGGGRFSVDQLLGLI